jgi:hypothetical protein
VLLDNFRGVLTPPPNNSPAKWQGKYMCTEGGLIQVMTLLKEQSVITFSIMFSILGELKEIFS